MNNVDEYKVMKGNKKRMNTKWMNKVEWTKWMNNVEWMNDVDGYKMKWMNAK